jgi:DNA-directed RNA polymerase specialized sigma24 family protein
MYKEEMISDGIENCLQYIHNFNPEKSQNPFAYFTQIIWYAFLRRISKEKKQMYIKFKASQRQMFDSEVFDDSTGTMVGAILPDYISEFIDDFETKLKVKKEEAAERSAEAAANAAAEDKSDTK